MVPKPQRVCLPASPVILAYAECLLIIQYIYGFNLNDQELPTVTSGGITLSQIGLVKYNYPCTPLAVQVRWSSDTRYERCNYFGSFWNRKFILANIRYS